MKALYPHCGSFENLQHKSQPNVRFDVRGSEGFSIAEGQLRAVSTLLAMCHDRSTSGFIGRMAYAYMKISRKHRAGFDGR